MSKIQSPAPAEESIQAQELCFCVPPGPCALAVDSEGEDQERQVESVPVAPALSKLLQATLVELLPRATPFSLLLLHVTQFTFAPLPPGSPVVQQRLNCHAPASFLEQVLHPIRRTLRVSDRLLVDAGGSGAVLLFPQVDRVGIACIAERVSHCINLLQAETIVPPLRQQTEIVLGTGSYPESAASLEELLARAGQARERIVFRPAVIPEAAPQHPRASRGRSGATARRASNRGERTRPAHLQGVPFMQIPSRLPTRLKQLVPHALALELRCVPVGRDHNRLTVAMADPEDAWAISHLREATGMIIFPVCCEPSALETLLASKW